ncbi:exosortase B [Janthinobacterium sp. CG_23.3]|uniref:exosortase B n=1 Tax=Janthinobacterium sp. CG_23.3 TaxID=3349634 RepID=UPI0038D37533
MGLANAGPALKLPRLKALAPEWLPIGLGLMALFIPTFVGLFRGAWATEEQAHGPIILALALWLASRRWKDACLQAAPSGEAVGWAIFVVALVLYVLGRSQQILSFEISSFILVLGALLLIKRGAGALRVLWFPFFFMLFMIPLPGSVVSALTMPMKMAVSYVTEHLLFWAGLPIARTGVILQIGQYQLLVADACAGLQTLLTLESLGLFYLNVVRHTSALRNIGLAMLIVPISFTANVIRVCVLTLITYYFGDAAGQGFLHGFAGMVLFISALVLIIGVDSFLQFIAKSKSSVQVGRQHE